ncbi:MAG: hypothetical protein Q9182_006176 [Xanthomendoza sp. 2 TL-2023]
MGQTAKPPQISGQTPVISVLLRALVQPCLGSPLTASKNLKPDISSTVPADPLRADTLRGRVIKLHGPPNRKRDDDDVSWDLVHAAAVHPIQPYDAGAVFMSQFYHFVLQAATGNWRNRPQGRYLHIVWRRVVMVMLVEGLEFIPWEMVATFAATMLDWINHGHVGFTFDGYYVKRAALSDRHGLYVGVRLMEMQEAVNAFLSTERDGILDPSNP